MREVVLSIGLGIIAGIIDIIPMIKKKLDNYSTISAFVQWIVLGIIITQSSIFGLESWLNGLVVAVLSSIPIVILVMKEDKKSVPIIIIMSAILGSVVGFIGTVVGIAK